MARKYLHSNGMQGCLSHSRLVCVKKLLKPQVGIALLGSIYQSKNHMGVGGGGGGGLGESYGLDNLEDRRATDYEDEES